MKQELRLYLEQVMRHSGLSRREKTDWIEEMSSHLQNETQRLVENGHDESEALLIAQNKFGNPKTLRKNIARETFGLASGTIYCMAVLCFVWFLIDLYVLQIHTHEWQYHRYSHVWGYITDILSTVPKSPSLALATTIGFLALFKTRCAKERLGLVSTLGIFGVLWILMRLPLSSQANEFVSGFHYFTYYRPETFGALVLWGLVLYLATNNRWVGLFPTIISVAVTVWIPIFDLVYNSLAQVAWNVTNRWFVLAACQSIVTGCLTVVVLLLAFKVIRQYRERRQSLISS